MSKKVDLQWFSDSDVQVAIPPMEFEGEEDIEVVMEDSEGVIEEGEEEREGKKSKEELKKEIEDLRGQADTAEALKSAVEQLGDKLAPVQAKQVVKEAKKRLRDNPEFAEKFNEEVFKDDPFGVIASLVEDVVKEQVGQIAGQVAVSTSDTRKKLLEIDSDKGSTFKKYKGEIEQFVAGLEPQYRNNPNVWEYAYDQVRMKHMDEIVSDMVETKVKELTEKKAAPEPQFSERAGKVGGSSRKTKEVTISKLERGICDNRGIPIQEYAKMKARGARMNERGEVVYE